MSYQPLINPHVNRLVTRIWHGAKREVALECAPNLPSLELYHQQVVA